MRAAFKALGDGKQVAVLAPTTVSTPPKNIPNSSPPNRLSHNPTGSDIATAAA